MTLRKTQKSRERVMKPWDINTVCLLVTCRLVKGCCKIPSLVGTPTFWHPCHRVPLLHPWSSTQHDQEEERRSGSVTGLVEVQLHWWNWCTGFYWENRNLELGERVEEVKKGDNICWVILEILKIITLNLLTVSLSITCCWQRAAALITWSSDFE